MGCTIFREKMMRNDAGHHHARLCNDPTDDNASENWPQQSSLSLVFFPFLIFSRVYITYKVSTIYIDLSTQNTSKDKLQTCENFNVFH
jgi:hypothetical protein